jgi:hypothetical protein
VTALGKPVNERERYGAAPDFDRTQLLAQLACTRCRDDATGPDERRHVVEQHPVKPLEDGPPWLCSLDDGPTGHVAVLCDACLTELQHWAHRRLEAVEVEAAAFFLAALSYAERGHTFELAIAEEQCRRARRVLELRRPHYAGTWAPLPSDAARTVEKS